VHFSTNSDNKPIKMEGLMSGERGNDLSAEPTNQRRVSIVDGLEENITSSRSNIGIVSLV
jgi:hypothetical protein